MIKAVIFDVGGVLLRTPNRESRRKWERKLGLDEWETEVIVFGSEMGTKAQLGEISDEDLWRWVGQRLTLTPDELASFRHDFWAGDVLDEGLIAYIRSLRPRYQTAIISNATDALRRSLTVQYAIADAFDLIVDPVTVGYTTTASGTPKPVWTLPLWALGILGAALSWIGAGRLRRSDPGQSGGSGYVPAERI